MNGKAAIFWVVFGLPLVILDAWLSVQAMFGLLNPHNPIMWAATILVGLFFTVFVVGAETAGMRRSMFGLFVWVIIFLIDMGTSMLCVVWYGQLHHSFKNRIILSDLRFAPGNWLFTLIYIILVIIALGACIQLGRAFKVLLSPWDY